MSSKSLYIQYFLHETRPRHIAANVYVIVSNVINCPRMNVVLVWRCWGCCRGYFCCRYHVRRFLCVRVGSILVWRNSDILFADGIVQRVPRSVVSHICHHAVNAIDVLDVGDGVINCALLLTIVGNVVLLVLVCSPFSTRAMEFR